MGQYDGGMVSQLGLGASFISIFGSLYIYFVNEDQSLGIFVGLWAPTLILISREVDKMLGWMSEQLMKKKHYPGSDKLTLCGHETTRQEYDAMLKGMEVNCNRCLFLKKNHKPKILHPLAK